MSHWEHIEDFTYAGFNFRAECAHDPHMGCPWEEYDGHGPVRESSRESFTSRRRPGDKKPGERVLWAERGSFLLYDWQGAMKIARRDGWGLSDEDRASLAVRLGRAPTRGEVCAEAVARDFDRLRRWANSEWWWVDIRVTLLDVEGEPVEEFQEYLGGIESDSPDYAKERARDLAAQIAANVKPQLGRKKTLVIEHGARVERIRVRA